MLSVGNLFRKEIPVHWWGKDPQLSRAAASAVVRHVKCNGSCKGDEGSRGGSSESITFLLAGLCADWLLLRRDLGPRRLTQKLAKSTKKVIWCVFVCQYSPSSGAFVTETLRLQENLAAHRDALHGIEKMVATHLGTDKFHELKQHVDKIDHQHGLDGYINQAKAAGRGFVSDSEKVKRTLHTVEERVTTKEQHDALQKLEKNARKVKGEAERHGVTAESVKQAAEKAKDSAERHGVTAGSVKQAAEKAKDSARLHGVTAESVQATTSKATHSMKQKATDMKSQANARSKSTKRSHKKGATKAKGSVMMNPLHAARQESEGDSSG